MENTSRWTDVAGSQSRLSMNGKRSPGEGMQASPVSSTEGLVVRGGTSRRWRTALYDFSQNTTLHGLNKITEDQPFVARRVIWSLIFLLGTALCVMQVVENIIYYRSWPVTVNVKINYNTSVKFPAVTICNQNDFRATSAASRDQYHLIRDFYTNLNSGGINVTSYNASDVSIEDIFSTHKHEVQDMIASCVWDESHCDADDFVTTVTDYGYCYTFNSGKTNEKELFVSSTGADRGLKLTLNIEQYEYMTGPTPGAGIKILIHDQEEPPLVGDFGQAIPPGSAAFVGIQIVKVVNLPPPHGVCDENADSVLSYYPEYSVSACKIERRIQEMMDNCGCRDFYMPSSAKNVPCKMEQFQKCLPLMADNVDQYKNHTCPVPCSREMFQNSISYGAISNYDMGRFLRSEQMTSWQKRYVKARETRDRMEETIFDYDTEMIHEFQKTTSDLKTQIISQTKEIVEYVRGKLLQIKQDLDMRLKFHVEWGLNALDEAVELKFIRGWEVFEERTFSVVTNNYQEVSAYIVENMATLADPGTENMTRAAIYEVARESLYRLKLPAMRARDNITTFLHSYMNAVPLLNYKISPNRRYDKYWLTKDIIWDDLSGLEQRSDILFRKVSDFLTHISSFEQQLKFAQEKYIYKTDDVATTYKLFDKAAREFNYQRFLLKSNYADRPRELVNQIIARFQAARDHMDQSQHEIDIFFNNLLTSLQRADSTFARLKYLGEYCNGYLNYSVSKTQVAELATAEETAISVRDLKAFIASLASYSGDIDGKLSTLHHAVSGVYGSLMQEKTLHPFYTKLQQDIALLYNSSANEERDDIVSIFSYMLDTNKTFIEENVDQLPRLMNTDLLDVSTREKEEELSKTFGELRALYQEDSAYEEQEDFFNAFRKLQESMATFLHENKIDASFFRENFLQIDVFMSELSYEEIEQQEAYTETNLWSDIGGSMGLFIGASVLTIFELVDVIIHTCLKFYFCGKSKVKK